MCFKTKNDKNNNSKYITNYAIYIFKLKKRKKITIMYEKRMKNNI